MHTHTHTHTHPHTLTHAVVVLHPVSTLTLITALGPRSRAAQLTRDMTRCVCVCVYRDWKLKYPLNTIRVHVSLQL